MEKLTGLCVLLAALSLAVTEDKYFEEGGTLTLDVRPSHPEPIKSILWKFNDNLLAEWIDGKVELEFYRSFKERSTLDITTGRLAVNRMSANDTGVYSVEINSNVQSVSYTAKWIKLVPQPGVVVRTLTCAASSDVCTVSCEGDTKDAEPVTYRWKMGDKDWEEGSGQNIEITKTKNGHDKDITCRITNPVSEKDSVPIINPVYRGEEPDPTPVLEIVLGVIGALAAVVGGAVFGMWKFKKGPFQEQGSDRTDIGGEPAKNPEVVVPLNQPAGEAGGAAVP